ncbi:hypothetical protein ACF064_35230 [Streptomyces sp. NPDC015492]|uniref:hypothetical protein n=1 Tax=Streptomyces sp. NPDC015492 TaxID=3364958 RepID=UPI0036FF8542
MTAAVDGRFYTAEGCTDAFASMSSVQGAPRGGLPDRESVSDLEVWFADSEVALVEDVTGTRKVIDRLHEIKRGLRPDRPEQTAPRDPSFP